METFLWAVYCPGCLGFFVCSFVWLGLRGLGRGFCLVCFIFIFFLIFLQIKVLSKMQIARHMEVSVYIYIEHRTVGPNSGCYLYLPPWYK